MGQQPIRVRATVISAVGGGFIQQDDHAPHGRLTCGGIRLAVAGDLHLVGAAELAWN